MQIRDSARKHGIPDEDILHALRNVLRYVPQEYDGESRTLALPPMRDGRLLELVVVPYDDPQTVIHADFLRAKFYRYL